MAVSERDRHELYRKLEGALGKEPADTMMALLPPVGWADVATKDDLRNLEQRMGLRISALQSRMDAMEERLLKQIEREGKSLYRTMVITTIGAVATVGTLAFAAAGLV